MTRTTSLLGALIAVVLSTSLAACSSEESTDATDGSTPTDATSETSTGSGVFPATVTHKFGTTTVESEPEWVVTVGLTEQDTLLQLGVTPIAVTEWYGEQPSATWPWAQDLLGDAKPEVLDQSDGLQFERIAALEPDLIVATNAGLEAKDYELLAAIAPTIASVEGSTQYFSSWQDQTMQIAKGLGREADGQALIDEVTDAYAAVAAAHPDWAGRSATFSQGGPYDGQLYVYPDGLSTDFLTDLGFTITPGLDKYAPDAGSQAQISGENVNLLEADVVVFATEDQKMFDELQAFATVATLPAVAEGRAVYTDETLAGAIYFDTPLSLLYVLERLTPLLEKAVTGGVPASFPTT